MILHVPGLSRRLFDWASSVHSMEESWDLVEKRRLKQQRQAEINARKDGGFFTQTCIAEMDVSEKHWDFNNKSVGVH